MKYCALCKAKITNDEAPILTMNAVGAPKLLCDACALDVEDVTSSKDYDTIAKALGRISEKLEYVSDDVSSQAIRDILDSSIERAELIKAGEYDFSLDEEAEGDFDELPEELLESEEDKEKDEKEARLNDKINRVLNVLLAVVGTAAVVAVIIAIVKNFI